MGSAMSSTSMIALILDQVWPIIGILATLQYYKDLNKTVY